MLDLVLIYNFTDFDLLIEFLERNISSRGQKTIILCSFYCLSMSTIFIVVDDMKVAGK